MELEIFPRVLSFRLSALVKTFHLLFHRPDSVIRPRLAYQIADEQPRTREFLSVNKPRRLSLDLSIPAKNTALSVTLDLLILATSIPYLFTPLRHFSSTYPTPTCLSQREPLPCHRFPTGRISRLREFDFLVPRSSRVQVEPQLTP